MKLREAIDKLFELKEKRKAIEKEEKEIKDKIKRAVEKGKIKVGEYRGEIGYLRVIEQITYDYDNAKIANKIGTDNYIQYSKPKVTDIRRDFGDKVLSEAIVGEKKTIKLEVS